MLNYSEFLERKRPSRPESGIVPGAVNETLYPFESAVVRWAVRRGRAAIFADCGMGKTFMQLEWARLVLATREDGRALIVAPLSVTHQTIEEGRKLGLVVTYDKEPSDEPGLRITNYQRLERFSGVPYDALVIDESSILKSLDGKTRSMILDDFTVIPYRLACTATPAPNDLTELGNHAQFVGVMSWREMSATFFVKESNGMAWRLKGHARDAFYKWLSTWCVYMRRPEDIGFADSRFVLPPLSILDEVVDCEERPADGRLFHSLSGLTGRIAARKATSADRVKRAAEIAAAADGPVIVWCGLNQEGRDLARLLGDSSVLVEGSMTEEDKIAACNDWTAGRFRVMVSKPSIFGFGMNFQHCADVIFLGLSDSYEQYYQAIRRCWRYGQTRPVTVTIVTSGLESQIVSNVRRKEAEAASAAEGVVRMMADYETEEVSGSERAEEAHATDEATGDMWTLKLGDSTERLSEIADESVGLSVFSPPFVSLYTYTATPRDLGNSKDEAVFFEHFDFIIRELLRVTIQGRLCCVHVSQIPAMLVRDGYIGMKDFRAATVAAFDAAGWVYHGEVVIDKDPQAQAIRTKAKGLLFTQLKKDASWLRPALADYICVFRKPGENPAPIKTDLSNEDWIQWARPIWYGISESDTLQYRLARTDKDERHICPLQLGVIERCVRLWSNRGDTVLSPFAGIGSEGYVAVTQGRRFIGVELKEEYWRFACENMREAGRRVAGLPFESSASLSK